MKMKKANTQRVGRTVGKARRSRVIKVFWGGCDNSHGKDFYFLKKVELWAVNAKKLYIILFCSVLHAIRELYVGPTKMRLRYLINIMYR